MKPRRPLSLGIGLFLLCCSYTRLCAQQHVPTLPAGFIRNLGQVKAREGGKAGNIYFLYSSPNGDADVYVTSKGLSYVYKKLLSKKATLTRRRASGKSFKSDTSSTYHYNVERIDAVLTGATLDSTTAELVYAQGSQPQFNYYDGETELKGQRLIETIVFNNVYPGIDWLLKPNQKGGLTHEFVVHQGADPTMIRIAYSGNTALTLNEDGSLTASGSLGFIKEGRPALLAGEAMRLPMGYKLQKNTLSYTAPSWPTTYPYTIDPDLYWGTFLHSTLPFDGIHWSTEYASDVTTDANNNIFTVVACSGSIQFPTLNPGGGAYYSDVYDNTNGSTVYMKFSPAGVLLWSTYFNSGAGGGDNSAHVVADHNGNLIACGTYVGNLPLKDNGGFFVNSSVSGSTNSNYLAKFDNNGVLLWCSQWSYFDNMISELAVDADNNFYLTGWTTHPALPLKNPGGGAYFNSAGSNDYTLFVSKFDGQNKLVWSTDIPNSGHFYTPRIAVDINKNVYLLIPDLGNSIYPMVNAGGYFRTDGTSALTKFDAGYHMVWSTTLPSFAGDVTTDPVGNVYEVGQANSNAYPYVDPGNGAYMNPTPGNIGGNVMKFDPATNLTWSTTYFNVPLTFEYAVFEPYRNVLHVFGYMNGQSYTVPTQNDACNGGYFHSAADVTTNTDPMLFTFTQGGQLLYASFNAFPYAYYYISAFTVDTKGDEVYVFGQIQEVPPLNTFPALKDPGGGAFYQAGSNNDQSEASFLMKLTPSQLNFTTSVQPPTGCNCSGTMTVTPYCGSGNYQYQWSSGDVSPTVNNACPGNYTVKITDMSTLSDTTIKLSLPNPPANVTAATLTATPDHCSQTDGSIQVSNVTGGPAPYAYALDQGAFGSAPSFTALPAGPHQITVEDNDGCKVVNSIVVAAAAGPDAITTSVTPTACSRDDGQVLVTSIHNGTAPYTYAWNGGAPSPIDLFQSLGAGSYPLTVYDVAGCNSTITVTVPMAQGPSAVDAEPTATHCGQSIGALLVAGVTGGQSPYSYSLDNLSFQPAPDFANLPAGDGTLYLQDAEGCAYSTPYSITDLPGPQQIAFIQKDAVCGAATGSVQIQRVTGGSPPYVYAAANASWSGETILQGLPPGKDLFSVEDAYGCTLADSTVILATPPLRITVSPGDTLVCAADKVNFQATATGANVSFVWNDGATGSSYQTSFLADTLVIVQATDPNGCKAADSIAITIHYCDSLLFKCVVFPNAFTPNADGSNDKFGPHISSCDVRGYELSIFDRWGQLVFHATDPSVRWDGRRNGNPPLDGTYIYTCAWTDDLGVTRHLKGFIVLVR